MPKMGEGKQIKIWLPMPIYAQLSQEAEETGRSMAEIGREEIAGRYRGGQLGLPTELGIRSDQLSGERQVDN